MTTRQLFVEVPGGASLQDRVASAVELERLGVDGLTLAEIADPDAFVLLALVAQRTERVQLETDVVQVGVRTPTSIAASAATLQEASGGRFGLGVGISSEAIVADWHGQQWRRPLGHARDALAILRAALTGERTDHDGEVLDSHGFRLSEPPAQPVAVHLAALNQGMLRVAAERADGVWLNYLPVQATERVSQLLDEWAEAAGRPAPRKALTCLVDVTDDVAATRAALREFLAFYMAAPAYRSALAWHGFAQEMADAETRFLARDRDGVKAAITDELIDSIALVGDATAVRDRMEDYFDQGIDVLSVAPLEPRRRAATLEVAVRAAGRR